MPLVSMCYNGVSACLVPLAISHLQQQSHVAVYFVSEKYYSTIFLSLLITVLKSQNKVYLIFFFSTFPVFLKYDYIFWRISTTLP